MTNLSSTISNTGNTDITTDIAVGASVRSFETGATVYSDIQAISSVAVGEEQVVNFTQETIGWDPGTYFYDVFTDNNDDINPGNDLNMTEIDVVDISEETTTLSYVTGINAAPTPIQWAGGGNGTGGGGIEIEPPFYPFTIL